MQQSLTHVSFAWSPSVPDVRVESAVPRSSTAADAELKILVTLMTPSFFVLRS